MGRARSDAMRVFGASFARVVATTYAELDEELEGRSPATLAVAVGEGMPQALATALRFQGQNAGAELLVEVPTDVDLADEVYNTLAARGAGAYEVRRIGGRPCLVLARPPHDAVTPDRVLRSLIDAASGAPDARQAEQEAASKEWEWAALQNHAARRQEKGAQLRGEPEEARRGLAKGRMRAGLRSTTGASAVGGSPGRSLRGLVNRFLNLLGARSRRARVALLVLLVGGVLLVLVGFSVMFLVMSGRAGFLGGAALGWP